MPEETLEPGGDGRPQDAANVEKRLLEELARLLPPHSSHEHAPIPNVNVLHDEKHLSLGNRVADRFAAIAGSWRFIITQSIILVIWIALNVFAWVQHWDPYPFILLNLALSFQAAYAAPIIMMSQNRQATKDRITADADYQVNQKAEDEIKLILNHLEYQNELLLQILHRIDTELTKKTP